MNDVTLEIDGREVKTEKGKTILEAAEKAGIRIPTLCYYPGLSPAGACRLCSVEITQRGRKRIVTACCYPVEERLMVNTKSPKVIDTRKMIIELMLTRCPNVKIIQDLAREYGVEKPRFKLKDEKCILCGLCERVCNKIGKNVVSFVGRGIKREVKTPYQISSDADLDFCVNCGSCLTVCPTGAMDDIFSEITKRKPIPIPSEFEMGLTSRKPVYLPFPYAVPNIPTIDQEKCAHFATGECKICEEICDADAINFDQKEEDIELNVGVIIVATGYDIYDARKKPQYGYGIYKNVITGLEFERFVSAVGPKGGKILRPSDNKPPKSVAFIQCVGSRDATANRYCSRVCCMASLKHAHQVKEKYPDSEVSIFYMDIRAFGKGYEEFYERTQDEGVRFIRGKVAEIYEDPSTHNLRLRFEDTLLGEITEAEFDMVVLATAMVPRVDTPVIQKLLKLSLSPDGFFLEVHPKLRPVESAVAGIYLAGAAQGPKDIPDVVSQARGAASGAAIPLAQGKVAIDPITAIVDEDVCSGCGICEDICPYTAIEIKEDEKGKRKSKVNETLCNCCGVCSAACPSNAIAMRHFTDKQISAQVEALLASSEA